MSPLWAHRAAAVRTLAAAAAVACLPGCDDGDPSERAAAPARTLPVHSIQPSSPRAAPLLHHCDGRTLPSCPDGLTGPSCTLPCPPGAEGCGFELYCHGDGSVYGLATRGGAILYPYPASSDASSDTSPTDLHAALVDWITTHEEDLALAPGLDEPNLGLAPAPGSAQAMGGLVIHRFTQTYRSLPVLPPDDLVQVVHSRRGAIQLTGRIVDARIDYEHHAAQAPAPLAEESIRYHAYHRTGVPWQDIVVDGPTLVAMPEARRIAWLGHARHVGGAVLGRVIVDADPESSSSVLPLVSWRPVEVEDLATTTSIQVRTASPSTDPAAPSTSVETTLANGEPLVGSIDDASGDVQLATEAVVVLDLHGGSRYDLDTVATRILDPNGEFLAPGGAGLQGQLAHHLLHSWHALVDGYLTDPVSGTKRWDSALSVYAPGQQSAVPAGTFVPRMLAFVDSASSDCPATAVACAGVGAYDPNDQDAMAFPELVHGPAGPNLVPEITGRLSLPSPGAPAHGITTLAHEAGHLVDLFAGPGFTSSHAPDCGAGCSFECVEDTSDEAPPLGETIAQLVGMLLLHHGFQPVGFEYCDIVAMMSRSNVKAFDPGPCMPRGEDISVLERRGACSKPEPYCDKPAQPGFRLECCDPALEADCIVEAPTDCPATGFQRQVPTGLCHHWPGYNTHSTMQAFWQLLNGQRCEPVAPFACETVAWPGGMPAQDAVVPAFLYSLRLDPLSYDQLFDGMATYIACTYGSDAYLEYNAVVCAHGIRGCDEPMPVVCEHCGNGVREGEETCDGVDWAHDACADFEGYDAGELRCNALTCQLDLGHCHGVDDGGLDSTAGTEDGAASTGVMVPDPDPQAATETDGDPAGADDGPNGGCSCRSAPGRTASLLPLLVFFLACLPRRHRRRSPSWPERA